MRTADSGLIERLEAVLRRRPVRLAVLFGSVASGKSRRESDVDVAILESEGDGGKDDQLTLTGELALAADADIDLVRIETASTLLKWQIATKGVLIWESSPGEFRRVREVSSASRIRVHRFRPGLRLLR
jgi:uncharacterized protein